MKNFFQSNVETGISLKYSNCIQIGNCDSHFIHQINMILSNQNFPIDGTAWSLWDFSAPLYDHFYIFGTSDFSENSKPKCLYEYPDENSADKYGLEEFIFVDGIQHQTKQVKDMIAVQRLFSKPVNKIEEVLFVRYEAGNPLFIFCIRFRVTPFSRPALLSENCIIDFIKYRDLRECPCQTFAACITTSHPFHRVFFPLLKFIISLETYNRMTSPNLFMMSDGMMRPTNEEMENSLSRSEKWPESSFYMREQLLNALYSTNLPTYGEKMAILLNNRDFYEWKMPQKEEVPMQLACWGSKPLFTWISVNDLIKLISAVFLEYHIIVVGKSLEEIIRTVVFLPQIISPFLWMSPLITILPPTLFEMLDSPMATIIGIYAEYINKINFQENCVINLDTRKISIPNEEHFKLFSGHQRLYETLNPLWIQKKKMKQTFNKSQRLSILRVIKDIIISTIADTIVKSIVQVHDDFEFNSLKFMRYFDYSDRDFIGLLLQSQLFASYVDHLVDIYQSSTIVSNDYDTALLTRGTLSLNLAKKNRSKFTFGSNPA